jgi:FkbM family methyltransferase
VSLIRRFYPYGAVRHVVRGPARGCRFIVAPGIGTSFAWGARDAVSPPLWQYVQPAMVFYDIGANKGQMALIAGRTVGARGRVFSFEPAPEEYTHLETNVQLNPDLPIVTIAAAVSNHTRGAAFAYDPDRPTEGRLVVDGAVPHPTFRLVQVPTIRLDDFAANHPAPDIIKIDVEGGGAQVIDGGMDMIRTHRPRIYFELHSPAEEAAAQRLVDEAGYSPMATPAHAIWLEPCRRVVEARRSA